jgi:hypothetical protein
MDILHKYLEFLWNSFQYDIQVFSHGWLYYWLLIPAFGYFVFFIFKWIVLMAPLWLPIGIIIRMINLPSPRCEGCIYKTAQDFDDLNEDKVVIKDTKRQDYSSKPVFNKSFEEFN